MSNSRYLAVNVQSLNGGLVAPRFRRIVWTLPFRLDWGSVRSTGFAVSRFWLIVCARKSVFWVTSVQEKFPVSRVRIGRLRPLPSVRLFATLLGGSELCPVCGAPVASLAQPPAATAAVSPKHGLSALTRLMPLSNTDSVYPNCSCQFSRAQVAPSRKIGRAHV